MNRAWEPKPCRHCGGFCGDSGPTCDERYDAVWGGAKTVEAVPNTDSGLDAVIRHRLFVYEVDFGDEGKGRYIRLSDFNKVVADYDAACEPFVRNNSSEEFINIRVPTSAVTKLRAMLAAAPAASATSKTHDRCTDPENCKRCSEDASTPHAGIPHATPAASGVDTSTNEAWAARAQEKIAAMDAGAPVSERARALLAAEYRTHGWHEDADRLCMGGDPTSFVEDDALRVIDRLIEQGDEDNHVITELGRLLAGIAVILKGPEPAGTAWSYHDLPALVASEVAEPRQVAAEMKAWAHTKMADQQSSRRDRMMVAEWAKRLLPESSFPVKDFDVEGMSITKEAAREAVKRVALEQALTQQRGGAAPQPSADAVRELVKRWRDRDFYAWDEAGPQEARENCADELESLLGRGGK